MSRSTELLRSIPPATIGIIGLCCLVYGYQIALDPYLHHYTLCPRPVLYFNEYYRILTSTLFHGSIMHIGMNMLSTVAISTQLEKKFGTFLHWMGTLWAMLLTSCVYIAISVVLDVVFGYNKLMYQHSLGFSGVLFHMSVLEANLSREPTRRLFGMVTIPSYLYPWALLIVLQMFLPNLSFLGHLSGIFTGTLHLYGMLDVLLVGEDYTRSVMERWFVLRWIVAHPNFVQAPSNRTELGGGSLSSLEQQRDPAALRRSIQNGGLALCKFIKDVLETIKVGLFGYGREANSNLQLSTTTGHGGTGRNPWRRGGSSTCSTSATTTTTPSTTTVPLGAGDTTASATALDAEDDDWVGLPPIPSSPPPPSSQEESRMV